MWLSGLHAPKSFLRAIVQVSILQQQQSNFFRFICRNTQTCRNCRGKRDDVIIITLSGFVKYGFDLVEWLKCTNWWEKQSEANKNAAYRLKIIFQSNCIGLHYMESIPYVFIASTTKVQLIPSTQITISISLIAYYIDLIRSSSFSIH